jgi:hypothetical protein
MAGTDPPKKHSSRASQRTGLLPGGTKGSRVLRVLKKGVSRVLQGSILVTGTASRACDLRLATVAKISEIARGITPTCERVRACPRGCACGRACVAVRERMSFVITSTQRRHLRVLMVPVRCEVPTSAALHACMRAARLRHDTREETANGIALPPVISSGHDMQ